MISINIPPSHSSTLTPPLSLLHSHSATLTPPLSLLHSHSSTLTPPLSHQHTPVALHYAAENHNHMAVRLLVEAGVPISAKNKDVSVRSSSLRPAILIGISQSGRERDSIGNLYFMYFISYTHTHTHTTGQDSI